MTQLAVWLEASDVPVGIVASDDHGAMAFAYRHDWLDNENAHPISLSLPLADEPFGDAVTRSFFDNLLQENDQLDRTLARYGLGRDNIVGILEHIGADCAGAISCLPLDAPPVKRPGNLATDYDELSAENVEELVTRLAEGKALPEEMHDPSPVAGFRRKFSLAATPDGTFWTPKAGVGVPTTHILKIPDPDHRGEAAHEAFAARMARETGLDSANCINDKITGQDVLLIERFDRSIDEQGNVRRLHQEDFAQAIGLPAELKYERRAGEAGRFDAAAIGSILAACASPAKMREDFIRLTIFNLLIGNNDNHAKNHALLHAMGSAPVLAPFYDLVPVQIMAGFTDEFSFNIGNAKNPEELIAGDLEAFCIAIGIPVGGALAILRRVTKDLIEEVEAKAPEIPQDMRRLDNLIGERANQLNDLLGLDLELRQRDAHLARGGGWQLS